MTTNIPATFQADSVPALLWRELGERLRGHAFRTESIVAAERILPSRHDALRLPLVHHRLRAHTTAEAGLLRLFVYDDRVARDIVEGLLGKDTTASALAAGILREEAEGLSSVCRITPFETALVASDPSYIADPVIAPGITTMQLAQCLPEIRAGSTLLDLGTGPGTLAVMAAQRGAHAVATDVSERALAYSRATAALNDVSIEIVLGDMDEPVRGRRFDVVVCQPPYVPMPPQKGLTYLHGGVRGDELAWRAIEAAPSLLASGGIALVRTDLPGTVESAAQVLLERAPASTLAFVASGPPIDELVVAYASAHHRVLDARITSDVVAYAEHFAHAGVERMSSALLVIDGVREAARPIVRLVSSLTRVDARAIAANRASIHAAALPREAFMACSFAPPDAAQLDVSTDLTTRKTRYTLRAPAEVDRDLSEPVALLLDVLAQGAPLTAAAEALANATEIAQADAERTVEGFCRDALRTGLLRALA